MYKMHCVLKHCRDEGHEALIHRAIFTSLRVVLVQFHHLSMDALENDNQEITDPDKDAMHCIPELVSLLQNCVLPG